MPFDNTCLYPEKFSGFSFSKKLQKYLVVSKTFPTFVPLKYNLCDNSRPFEGFFYALTIHIRLSFSKFFVFARVIFKQREQAAVFNFLPKCLKITNMSTTTIQLTPKVATVPTSKALHFFNEAVSGLFNQSIFLHYC